MVLQYECTEARDRYAGLKENIRKIYHYHKGRYGYRRITLALRKQGCG
ncbi:IS3 family transposase [Klebsiella pneumoniae]